MNSTSELPHLEKFLSIRIKYEAQRILRLTSRYGLKLMKQRRGGRQTLVLPTSARTALDVKNTGVRLALAIQFRRNLRVKITLQVS